MGAYCPPPQQPGIAVNVISTGKGAACKKTSHPIHSGEYIVRADRENGPILSWKCTAFPKWLIAYGLSSLIFAILAFIEIVPTWDFINPRNFLIGYAIAQFLLWLINLVLLVIYGCYSDYKNMSHRNWADLVSWIIVMTFGTILSTIILGVFQNEFKLENTVNATSANTALYVQYTIVFLVVFVLNTVMFLATISAFYALRYPEEIVMYTSDAENQMLLQTIRGMRVPKDRKCKV